MEDCSNALHIALIENKPFICPNPSNHSTPQAHSFLPKLRIISIHPPSPCTRFFVTGPWPLEDGKTYKSTTLTVF